MFEVDEALVGENLMPSSFEVRGTMRKRIGTMSLRDHIRSKASQRRVGKPRMQLQYSPASVEERATVACFFKLDDTTSIPRMKQLPEVLSASPT
ncbi:hypothetical protein Tco_0400128 [Tanacetum coccineum]